MAARWPPRFVFIDANGQVGSIASMTIGDQGPRSEEDLAGSLLHDFLTVNRAAAANAFHASSGDFTYTSRHGTKHRIDY
eukprot:1968706-Pyramimonas_sp.AAC.1